MFGSKEARYTDPVDFKNPHEILGPFSSLFHNDYVTLGMPAEYISVAYNWGISDKDERELLRVSVVNHLGLIVFDSVV